MNATPSSKRYLFWLFLLYAGLAATMTLLHTEHVTYGRRGPLRMERHEQILDHEGDAPWIYRVGTPMAANAVSEVQEALGVVDDFRDERSYLILRFFTLMFTFLAFHAVCQHWLTHSEAITATVLLAGLHGPATAHYYFQPDSPADLLAWVLAAWLTLTKRDMWLFALIPLAAINRETAVFAVGIHLALRWGEEPIGRTLARTAALGALWAAVFLGLRQLIEDQGHALEHSLIENVRINFTSPDWMIYFFAFLGGLPWLMIEGWPKLPAALKRWFAVLVPYIVLVVLYGRVREVRLMLPVMTVIIPAALLALRDIREASENAES